MRRFYYDLHLHSCLSPCADDDNTPNNLAGMASLCKLDIVALTDHNTVKNCPAFFEAARSYGIIPIAGMELTTSEDIHVVCLFETLEDALRFGDEVDGRRVLIKNRPEIFGEQLILDAKDEIIGKDEYLLSNATTISLDEAPLLVSKFGGVCYPAHIDRDANGIIAILGTLPETPVFGTVELRDAKNIEKYRRLYALDEKLIVVDSDSHYLTDMKDAENYFEFEADSADENSVRRQVFLHLRGKNEGTVT